MVINSNRSADNLQNAPVSLTQPLAKLAVKAPANPISTPDTLSTLDAQYNSINAAQGSVSNAISFTQSQQGVLQHITKALDQMSQLAAAAQDPSATDASRTTANNEFQALSGYIAKASGQDFNGISLFAGIPVSVDTDSNGNSSSVTAINLQSSSVSDAANADISTPDGAASAAAAVQAWLKEIASASQTAKANHSTLDSISEQLAVSSENLTASNVNLAGSDSADLSMYAATASMLNQPAVTLSAQANQMPQSVLKLLEV